MRCLLSALAPAVFACGGSGDEPGEAGPPGADPLGTAQADEFLVEHNLVRANVQPAPGTPLPALAWSAQAAGVAQAWANECSYRHNSGHSFGENIAANTPPGSFTPAGITDAWASESADYDYASNTCSNVCGHYTQIVWADTLRLGCGKAYPSSSRSHPNTNEIPRTISSRRGRLSVPIGWSSCERSMVRNCVTLTTLARGRFASPSRSLTFPGAAASFTFEVMAATIVVAMGLRLYLSSCTTTAGRRPSGSEPLPEKRSQ